MTSQYRHRRTSISSAVFPNPIEPGEIAVNTANRQLAVGDAASASIGAPKPLLPIRYFDTAAQYVTNDFVVNGASLYRANKATGPGGFLAADWVMMVGTIDPQYVAKAGDVMTGPLSLPAVAPTAGVHATNKAYVDALVAAKSSVVTSDTPPAGVVDNTLWFETDTGLLYVRYNDGDSTQWVIACPQPDLSQFVAKAGDTMTGPLLLNADPSNVLGAATKQYVDAGNANQVNYTAQTPTEAQKTLARQNVYAAPFDAMAYSGLQVNGAIDISQEFGNSQQYGGAGGTAIGRYIMDGWFIASTGAQSISWQAVNSNVGASALPAAYPCFASWWLNAANNAPAAPDYLFVQHYIEGYRTARLGWGTAGAQPLSFGFWFTSTRIGTYSGSIRNGNGTRSYPFTFTVNAASTWEWKTFTIPGDTTGTWGKTNTTGLSISIAQMIGSTYAGPPNTWVAGNFVGATGAVNAAAGGTDQFGLTGLIVLPGIELPSITRAPYVMRPADQELALCQRYYRMMPNPPGTVLGNGSGSVYFWEFPIVPTMRATPAISITGNLGISSPTATYQMVSVAVNICQPDVFSVTMNTSATVPSGTLALMQNANALVLNARL